MMRRVPLIPTMVVMLAVAVMVALGIWQIGRAREKEALLARLATASTLPTIAFPSTILREEALPLFRRARATCTDPGERRTVAGQSVAGEVGYVHVVRCRTPKAAAELSVAVGWSKNPNAPFSWGGGEVHGLIAPDSRTGMRIVAERAVAGLQPAEPPSLESIPNNHRGYVITWFAFALLALVIYGVALRTRLRSQATEVPAGGKGAAL